MRRVCATGIELESKVPIPREARDRQLRFQLDSGREHPPHAMSSSETGHCYGGIDDCPLTGIGVLWFKTKGRIKMCAYPGNSFIMDMFLGLKISWGLALVPRRRNRTRIESIDPPYLDCLDIFDLVPLNNPNGGIGLGLKLSFRVVVRVVLREHNHPSLGLRKHGLNLLSGWSYITIIPVQILKAHMIIVQELQMIEVQNTKPIQA
eukprot:gene18297-biopygen5326